MTVEHAVIESTRSGRADVKVCGLYILERNIVLLARSGVRHIHLRLSAEEAAFFGLRVKKRVAGYAAAIQAAEPPDGAPRLIIPAGLFFQAHHLSPSGGHLSIKGDTTALEPSEEIFEIADAAGARRAEGLIAAHIRDTTPGFIARRINKTVSLAISRVLSKTRVHPNYLTLFNMAVGFSSAFFIAMNTYPLIVLGGFFFQLASVLDGVDGEVAKMTLKVSKLGGWLDTISDNGTLILFLSASSYLYFIKTENIIIPLAFIALLFTGLGTMLAAMISFLRKHTDSGSLVTYDKEFLQKLPDTDRLLAFIRRLKYITKKEFFSLAFFAICLTGYIHYLVPMAAVVLSVAAVLLLMVNRRYRGFIIGKNDEGKQNFSGGTQ